MPVLYPPHPASKISPHRLAEFEAGGGWIAQRKFNGTHVVIHVSKDRRLTILTRHGTPPKLFSLTKSHRDQILSLNMEDGKEYWFDGELLDHKTRSKEYKGKIVLFDVLQAGDYLIRKKTQKERLALLAEICRNPSTLEPANGIALDVTGDIWLAESWTSNFAKHFTDFIQLDEIEGLILRKSDSVIDNFGNKEYDVAWIVRCRKPHAGGNYNF
jgi:ATP-dependent DNA ligase